MKSTHSSVGNHDKVVEFYINLNTQLERLEVETSITSKSSRGGGLVEAKIVTYGEDSFAKLFFTTCCVAQSSGNAILNSPRFTAQQTQSLAELGGIMGRFR